MEPAEGRLHLHLTWDGQHVCDARVESSRPLLPCRVLEGRSAAESLALVPRLFSVCARAQTVAAIGALQAAQGGAVDPAHGRERELLLAAECAHEHLWRLLLDLPPLLGQPAQASAFIALRHAYEAATRGPLARTARADPLPPAGFQGWSAFIEALSDLLAQSVLGMPPSQFFEMHDTRRWDDWRHDSSSLAARWLQAVEAAGAAVEPAAGSACPRLAWPDPLTLQGEIAEHLLAEPLWSRQPTLQGRACEPGALARQQAHPLLCALHLREGPDRAASPLVRLQARLIELAQLVGRMRALCEGDDVMSWTVSRPLPGPAGVAAVETARGTLVHRLWLDLPGTGVRQWRTVAPTEWAFHPAGPWATGLIGARAPDQNALHRHAQLLAHALDPCVPYEITVHHA